MTFRLPRLPAQEPPWASFQLWWQKLAEQIEAQEASQNSLILQLQDQLAKITATQRRDAISASFTIPTLVATASDAGGGNAKIDVAVHSRQYGDETNKSVSSGTVSGLTYSTDYAVYYDDPDRLGGTVTYHATTDLKSAQNNFIAGRHYVATVTTPASGGASVTGGTPPPGSGYVGGGGLSGFKIV